MTKYDAATDPFCYGYITAAKFSEPYSLRFEEAPTDRRAKVSCGEGLTLL